MSLSVAVTAAVSGAVAGGLAVGGFAYASLWPASRVVGRALVAPRNPDEMALTFDDGPNPAWTPRLLDLLAGHLVHATLFTMGDHAHREKDLVRRAHAEGHAIGIHSWSHPNLARSSEKTIREELTRSREEIEQTTGAAVRLFRPPFGARRPAVFRIAREMGLTTVLWNAMTNDWAEPSVDRIEERLTKRIGELNRKGWAANVVLHDGGHLAPAIYREPSVTAAGRIMERYKATKRFVTLEEWA